MYSRMKRKSSFIVLVVMVVSLLMVSGTPVHADDYGWMESAKKVKINSTIKGVARNNQPPTLMDPWDSYEEYFYFKAPVKMNITITVTMKGTQGVSVSLYNSRGNYLMDSNDWLYNRSKNQNSTILRSTCNAGEYYIRLRFANSNMVMCMERNIGENHQCCCGQVYSNKNNKCPLCGKERRGK